MARQKKDPTKIKPQEKSDDESTTKDGGQESPDSTTSTQNSPQNSMNQGAPGGTLANKIVELMFSKMGGSEVAKDSKLSKAQQQQRQQTVQPNSNSASSTTVTNDTAAEEAILDLSVKSNATSEEVRVKEEAVCVEEESEVFDDVGALDLSMKRKTSSARSTLRHDIKRRRSSENSGTFPTPPCTPKNTSPNFVFTPAGAMQNGPPLQNTRGMVLPNVNMMPTAHHALGATVVAALMGQTAQASGHHPSSIAAPALHHGIPAALANREAANLSSKEREQQTVAAAAAGHPPAPMLVNPHGQPPTLLRFPYALPPGTFVTPAGLPGGGPRLISPHLLATLRHPLMVNRHLTMPHHPPAENGHSTTTTSEMKAPHLLKYMNASHQASSSSSPPCSVPSSPPDTKSPTHQENRNGPLVFTCKTCGIPFPTVRKLAGHMKIHNNDKLYYSITVEENGRESTIYVCQTCGTQFTIYENLISHMQHHGGEDMYSFYICEVCNARFTQASDLKIHSRIHIRDKPFTCNICKNKFTHLQSLKTHQRIHTGEKPYQCKVCQARFTQLGHLKAHSRIHTGEKPYQCGTCGAKFSQLGTLKVHMRIHTGEKPYQCKTCDARFTHLRSLKLHTLRSHIDDLTQAEQDQLKQDTGSLSSATQQVSPEPQAATASAAAAASVDE